MRWRLLLATVLLALSGLALGDVAENVQYIPIQRVAADRPGILLNDPFPVVSGGVDPRWDNLVAGWKLDEESDGSGGVVRADVLGTYDLTDNNTTPSTTGVIGNAASFASANAEALTVVDGEGLKNGGALSVIGWAKFVAGPIYPMIVSRSDSSTFAREWEVFWLSSALYAQYNGSVSRNTPWPADGDWHFFCFRTSGLSNPVTISIIVDDGAASTNTFNFTPNNSSSGLTRISGYGNGSDANGRMNGAVDEVYVFNVYLSDDAVADFYNSGAGRSYPD